VTLLSVEEKDRMEERIQEWNRFQNEDHHHALKTLKLMRAVRVCV